MNIYRWFFIFFPLGGVLLLSCSEGTKAVEEDRQPISEVLFAPADEKPYAEVLTEAEALRSGLKKQFEGLEPSRREAFLKSAGEKFKEFLVDRIVPYWYGTEWDFNGTTTVPGQGAIACGYFITTLLEDMGVDLQRVKLAQQASLKIMETLDGDWKPLWHSGLTTERLENFFKKQIPGLYIIGLDYHTGFLLIEEEKSWFIHASYLDPVQVVKERVLTSQALMDSKIHVTGRLTTNPVFIRKWLMEEPFRLRD